ncbi:MAG: response regulator, partial [Spirochaetales bacterium]|nr:response regulator [Spirochaetales bacterium]
INRNIMVKLLEKVGATVKCTVNGKEGLEVFKASPLNTYSCILMDIKMPVMDGLTTALRIRQLEREDAKTIAIIAVSANAFDTDVKASLNSGMNAHLAKPFEPFKLYETILKYIKAK